MSALIACEQVLEGRGCGENESSRPFLSTNPRPPESLLARYDLNDPKTNNPVGGVFYRELSFFIYSETLLLFNKMFHNKISVVVKFKVANNNSGRLRENFKF